jgi:hypothetical protein
MVQYMLDRTQDCVYGQQRNLQNKTNSVAFSPQATYTDRSTAAGRRI